MAGAAWVRFFFESMKPTSPGASPVSLFWIPVTLRGVMRKMVRFWIAPVSPMLQQWGVV